MQERAAYGKLVAMANEADTARTALQVIPAAVTTSFLLLIQHTIQTPTQMLLLRSWYNSCNLLHL